MLYLCEVGLNMKDTVIININENDIDISDEIKYKSPEVENNIKLGCDILKNGGLVAFPTETVYGLGGDALKEDAARRIYAAKGRPSDNPLIVHIADKEDVYKLASFVSDDAKILMDKYWPGPLTLIFKKKSAVPGGTTGGLDTVAIRMPSNKIAAALIKESGVFIAAPSANISGRPSPTTGAHVVNDMEGRIDMIIDGGSVNIGLESTIVDVSGEKPVILRPGYITEEMLSASIGKVEIDPAIIKPDENIRPKAPGMKYRHYAPRAEFYLFSGNEEKVIERIESKAKEYICKGRKVGIIATDETEGRYKELLNGAVIISMGSGNKEEEIAHNLFAVLRKFDELETDVILGGTFTDKGLGRAIMNRLSKACGYDITDV